MTRSYACSSASQLVAGGAAMAFERRQQWSMLLVCVVMVCIMVAMWRHDANATGPLRGTATPGLDSVAAVKAGSVGKAAVVVIWVCDLATVCSGCRHVLLERKTPDYPIQPWASQFTIFGGNAERGDNTAEATAARELHEEGLNELALDIAALPRSPRSPQLVRVGSWLVHASAGVMPRRQAYQFRAVLFSACVSHQLAATWVAHQRVYHVQGHAGQEGGAEIVPIEALTKSAPAMAGQAVNSSLAGTAPCVIWAYDQLLQGAVTQVPVATGESGRVEFVACPGAYAEPIADELGKW